jgi:leucyl-tRNA synthetase
MISAAADIRVAELLAGKEIKNTIAVPGRMVNFVEGLGRCGLATH